MFYTSLSFCSRGGGLVPEGLCPGGGSLSRGRVSVQGEGLCPGGGSLSTGVSVLGVLCQGGSPYGKEWAISILLECFLV